MSKICTFVGNSKITIPAEILKKAKDIIIDLIENEKVTEFYFGCYGNFDWEMLTLVTSLKDTYPYIKTIFVTPYLESSTLKYITELKKCDQTIFPEIENTPYRYRILKRNEWMIKKLKLSNRLYSLSIWWSRKNLGICKIKKKFS